jgi:hypothetical protein
MTLDSSLRSVDPLPSGSTSAIVPFNIGSFDLVRKFIEHMVAKSTSTMLEHGSSYRNAIDWEMVEASVAGASSFEQAIGRAVVIADRMGRGVYDATLPGSSSCGKAEDPFFEFSLTEVVPDFGDGSRYRTKLANRVARIFGRRRAAGNAALLDGQSSPAPVAPLPVPTALPATAPPSLADAPSQRPCEALGSVPIVFTTRVPTPR